MRRSDLLRNGMMLIGGAGGFSTPLSPPAPIEAEVTAALKRFISAFDALDMARFIKCFASDAAVFTPTGDPHRLDGVDAIEAFFRKVFEATKTASGRTAPPYMKLEPRDLRIQSVGDGAVATFHLVESDSSVHRRTFVYRRESGVLKIIHLHASNFPPK